VQRWFRADQIAPGTCWETGNREGSCVDLGIISCRQKYPTWRAGYWFAVAKVFYDYVSTFGRTRMSSWAIKFSLKLIVQLIEQLRRMCHTKMCRITFTDSSHNLPFGRFLTSLLVSLPGVPQVRLSNKVSYEWPSSTKAACHSCRKARDNVFCFRQHRVANIAWPS
jgi:hypothetical protein